MSHSIFSKLTVIAACVVLLGIGCSDDTVTDPEPSTATPTSTVTTTVAVATTTPELTDRQFAFATCATQGFDVRLLYNEDTTDYDLFCQFDAERECPADEFAAGICTPETALTRTNLPQADGRIISLRTCDSRTLPVCGVDGQTYINRCIADVSGVTIASDGACVTPVALNPDSRLTEQRQSSRRNFTEQARSRFTNRSSNTSNQNEGAPPLPPTNEPYPSWVEVSATFLLQSGDPNARIDECRINNDIYYLQQSCPTCFSVLYDVEGEVACFPNNDITEQCPAAINNGSTSCTTIWRS